MCLWHLQFTIRIIIRFMQIIRLLLYNTVGILLYTYITSIRCGVCTISPTYPYFVLLQLKLSINTYSFTSLYQFTYINHTCFILIYLRVHCIRVHVCLYSWKKRDPSYNRPYSFLNAIVISVYEFCFFPLDFHHILMKMFL